MAKSKRHHGVYSVTGKRGTSYGIDYVHPQTGERVRKILKEVTSASEAAEIRAIEIADAKRGAVNKAYGIKDKPNVVSFESMVEAYLQWSDENPERKSSATERYNSIPLVKAFKGKLMSEINSWVIEKYKRYRIKQVSPKTVSRILPA